jgi:O-antigen/teichoic acid export membrane protein
MNAAGVLALVRKALSHPVAFLLIVNIACAGLGFAQFAYALSVLKPADFAAIGVLAAIGGVVTGLLDVKLPDLTTRLYYAAPKDAPERRAGILGASFWLHLAAGVLTGLAMWLTAAIVAPRFLDQTVAAWWVLAMTARFAVGYPIAALTTYLRIVGAFDRSGWLRLGTQIAVTAIAIGALVIEPNLDGFFAGAAIGAAVSIAFALAVAAPALRKALGQGILATPRLDALREILSSGRFLAGGSLLGLSKLVSRSGDTLLVAAFTGDTTTGLYRVARQAFDTLAGLSDAIHQFYTPTVVACINAKRWDEFAKHRLRLIAIGLATAAGAILASWLVLHPLAAAHYPHYLPALSAFEVMVGLLAVTIGVHGWLWPSLVAQGGVGRFGLLAMAGALLQAAALLALGYGGWLDATTAAAAAWLMAAVNYLPLMMLHSGKRTA